MLVIPNGADIIPRGRLVASIALINIMSMPLSMLSMPLSMSSISLGLLASPVLAFVFAATVGLVLAFVFAAATVLTFAVALLALFAVAQPTNTIVMVSSVKRATLHPMIFSPCASQACLCGRAKPTRPHQLLLMSTSAHVINAS